MSGSSNNNLSKYDRKKLNDGDNLNVKLGPYGSASNNIVGSLLNKPTQVLNGEVTIDWYPSNDNSNYGTQILRHTRDNTINIYFRAKKGSVDNWSEWINLATKDDLGIYFTAAGSKAAVYKQNVISVSIQLKAGYTYFLVGKNGVTISNDGLMSATFDVLSDAGSIFHFGNSRTTMSNGGGCVTAMIIKTVKDCTVNLIGYGYVNETYNYEGRIIAIQLA